MSRKKSTSAALLDFRALTDDIEGLLESLNVYLLDIFSAEAVLLLEDENIEAVKNGIRVPVLVVVVCWVKGVEHHF